MAKAGFIGLGNIGRGICKNLLENGNEKPPKRKRWVGLACFG